MSKEIQKKPKKEAQKSKTHQVEFMQWQATRVMEQVLEQVLTPYHLSLSEWRLLGLIREQGELQATEIALMMRVKLPLITRHIGSLKRKRWISVLHHAKDRRIKRILISEIGKEKLQMLEKMMSLTLRKSFRGVTKEEMQSYSNVLTKIIFNGRG